MIDAKEVMRHFNNAKIQVFVLFFLSFLSIVIEMLLLFVTQGTLPNVISFLSTAVLTLILGFASIFVSLLIILVIASIGWQGKRKYFYTWKESAISGAVIYTLVCAVSYPIRIGLTFIFAQADYYDSLSKSFGNMIHFDFLSALMCWLACFPLSLVFSAVIGGILAVAGHAVAKFVLSRMGPQVAVDRSKKKQ